MNPLTTPPANAAPVDEDLAGQAHPGHGIPSQDPNSAAQFLLEPEDASREARSVLVGGSLVAGAAAGAAIGVLAAGPVGVVVGATLGAVAGTLGGEAAGAITNPEAPNSPVTVPVDTARRHVENHSGGTELVSALEDPGR